MARVITLTQPIPFRGIARFAQDRRTRATALGALLAVVAGFGSLAVRAAAPLGRALAAWAQARREREEDRKLWELALSDSRVMADLIAVRQQAPAARSRYF
jgi:hypothetical protein